MTIVVHMFQKGNVHSVDTVRANHRRRNAHGLSGTGHTQQQRRRCGHVRAVHTSHLLLYNYRPISSLPERLRLATQQSHATHRQSATSTKLGTGSSCWQKYRYIQMRTSPRRLSIRIPVHPSEPLRPCALLLEKFSRACESMAT